MLSFEEALQRLLDSAVPPGRVEHVDTLQATGRVLAAAVKSGIAVPAVDNSAMDGYAVCIDDVPRMGTRLPVSQRVPAGSSPLPLETGTAARIFTGAPLPQRADAVVMQENCVADACDVIVNHLPVAGENIRRAGEDVRAGQEILMAGALLRAQDIGLAASIGVAQLDMFAALRVAVFFTGDELVMPGELLPRGAVYNSNRYVLNGLLARMGCVVTDLGIIPDDLAATRAALREAARDNDLVITCGGVSVGEEDHVRAAVEAEGSLDLWRIAIKPGKPLAFGRVAGDGDARSDTAFIGLPGNPVSSFVTFMTLVKPYIRYLQGASSAPRPAISMRADFAWTRTDARREFLRVRRNATGGLDLFPHQGSGVLTSCVWADGLVDNPPGRQIRVGDVVSYLPFEG